MTKGWVGWGVDGKGEENIKGLAKLTRGYGGADLRVSAASCGDGVVLTRIDSVYGGSAECDSEALSADIFVEKSTVDQARYDWCYRTRVHDFDQE